MAFLECKIAHIARQMMVIKFPTSFNPYFIKRFVEISAPELKREAKSLIPGIARENLLALCVPLPPLTEQARIVTKIEELLSYNVADVCGLPVPIPPLVEQQCVVERVEELLAVCGQFGR